MPWEEVIENGVSYTVETANSGNKYWYKSGTNILHREGDLPAIEFTDTSKSWYWNGKQHREQDLPASVMIYPNEEYCMLTWYCHGQCHRTSGPAIIERHHVTDTSPPINQEWWYKGTLLVVKTQQEFEDWLKYKAFE